MLADDTPFVVFGDDWRRHVSTIQHLFLHIMGKRPVVWVNSFGHRAPQLTLYDLKRAAGKIRAMVAGHRAASDGRPMPARIIEPRALPWHNSAMVRRLNAWSLRRDIRRALDEVAPGRAPVLVSGTPAAVDIVGAIGEQATVYFVIDDYGELPNVDKDLIAPLEARMLQRADAVVATAKVLTEKKRPASGRAWHLPQGVNYDHFANPRPIPPDLAALPGPRIGFAGGVSSACDWEIIAAIADRWPRASIVLVGPPHPGVTPPPRANIHLFGNRPYDVLPAYVQHFDVGLVPYVLNDWTRSVDPLKLLEYLAAGIPVVSTAIPEAAKYAHVVSVAATQAEFVDAVAAALDRPADPAQGRAVARENTWARRADALLEMVAEVLRDRDAASRSHRGRAGAD